MRDPFEITAELIAETDMAILVNDGDVEVWLPKSQIEWSRRDKTRHVGCIVDITAPSWLLEQEGLV